MASDSGPCPADGRPVPAAWTRGPQGHEGVFQLWRTVLRGEPSDGAETGFDDRELADAQLAWALPAARTLDAGERALRRAIRLAVERQGPTGRPPAEDPDVRRSLSRAASLLFAAEAAAVLSARAVHTLTGELSVLAPVVSALVPTLVAEVTATLADLTENGPVDVLADRYEPVGPEPLRERNALAAQFPWLVHGFALESTDDRLPSTMLLGAPLPPLDRSRLVPLSRGGCSVVQALPAAVGVLGQDGATAHGGEIHDLAKAVLAAGDELHRRMAEVLSVTDFEQPDRRLAAGYEDLYAAAACLQLWSAQRTAADGQPLWEDGIWLRAALRELLLRLRGLLESAPADVPDHVGEALADRLVHAVRTGGPLTPFAVVAAGAAVSGSAT
ncbi:hypothetical protein [Kitasatospora sp. HPMI-4]|uniref:hypothetical protein n=1 Tax=Kitasatospora sp. HPMI-4 TaxID=3448443 RepID=UPI003F1C9B64